eukprot:UN5040
MKQKRGAWCSQCARDAYAKERLRKASEAAAVRGGLCLSNHYERNTTRMVWQCAEGHRWLSAYRTVLITGCWCPFCSHKAPLSLDIARTVAEQRGGLCLSTAYVNSNTKMRWRCENGHEWDATLNKVKDAGTWCPQCASGKSENEVRSIFQNIFLGQRFIKCRPDFLKAPSGRRLELDGFCRSLHLAFEYNGGQHYDADHHWNRRGRASFVAAVQRDEQKVLLCAGVGVRLVVV